MVNRILKGVVDLLYRTDSVRRKYEKLNPDEKVYAADGSKGITTKGDSEIERGAKWALSKRAVVMLTNKKIKCGDWVIPLENVVKSELVMVKSIFGAGQVLKLTTNKNENYQFGMQVNPEWVEQSVLPLEVKEGKIKTSPLSMVIRLIAIGYVIYLLIQKIAM